MSFVDRHGLASQERREATQRIARAMEDGGLEVVRFSFPDQHGVLRGKSLVAGEVPGAIDGGVMITSTLILKDTAHRTVFPVFSTGGGIGLTELQGGADLVMVADPTTFRVLPWAAKTGFLLCDLHFADGRPVPYATRHVYRSALGKLAERGYDFVAGLEVEFHIFRLEDARLAPADATQPGEAPTVSLLHRGYQYLTEQRLDEIEPVLEHIRRAVVALGLPLRSVELEFGPSQCEFTFRPDIGLGPADTMVLFRSAVKQICHRLGYHATFMCRPKLPNAFSSGWHLHQSLRDRSSGANVFASAEPNAPFSALAASYLGGLLAHARAAAAFTTPTLNGYKRYRAYSLAPDRAIWGRDNRGVMIRAIGGGSDPATRLENRVGEPLANPYLYMACQILCGLDGIDRQLDPGAPADTPYETTAAPLPRSLAEAITALGHDSFFRDAFGADFVDYYVRIKTAEIERFLAEVTDWEQREYFDLF